MNYKDLIKAKEQYEILEELLQVLFNKQTKNYLFFAFGTTEKEILQKLEEDGCNVNEVISIGNGAYIHKKDIARFNKLNRYISKVKKGFLQNPINLCGAYLSLLWDYEARISLGEGYDTALKTILNYAGLEKVTDLPREVLEALYETENYYNEKFDEIN